jgi:hypothetical protein
MDLNNDERDPFAFSANRPLTSRTELRGDAHANLHPRQIGRLAFAEPSQDEGGTGSDVVFYPDHKAGMSNLLTTHSALTGRTIPVLETAYQGKGCGADDLAEVLVEFITPVPGRIEVVFARYYPNRTRCSLTGVVGHGARPGRLPAQRKVKSSFTRSG